MNEDAAMNRPSTTERSLTQRQRVKIWASAREVGLSEDALYEHLERVVGKRSIRGLTRAEAKAFIDFLIDGLGASGHGRAFIPRRPRVAESQKANHHPPPAGGNVIDVGRRGKLETIAYLLSDLGLAWDSPYFVGVVRRATGRRQVRTSADASRVIDALRSIVRRQRDSEGDPRPAA